MAAGDSPSNDAVQGGTVMVLAIAAAALIASYVDADLPGVDLKRRCKLNDANAERNSYIWANAPVGCTEAPLTGTRRMTPDVPVRRRDHAKAKLEGCLTPLPRFVSCVSAAGHKPH
jgi:hypothetical protein